MSGAPMTASTWDAKALSAWSEPHLANVEAALSRWVGVDAPVLLGDAMRYAVLDGGKRLRPLLVLAASEAVGGIEAAALRAACATELIHAYSLVHDDLPCMDNDVLRRGKPTVHVKFGEADALLAGDALQALAFELLTPEGDEVPAAMQAALCRLLARAAGSQGMAGGQAIDLASIGIALERNAAARNAPAEDRRAASGQRRDGRGLRPGGARRACRAAGAA
jgi:farnesyl diphosphate synthase